MFSGLTLWVYLITVKLANKNKNNFTLPNDFNEKTHVKFFTSITKNVNNQELDYVKGVTSFKEFLPKK